ncbi:hypothetical protein V1506DRAFT_508354 [Lipomyces tetrasporus]
MTDLGSNSKPISKIIETSASKAVIKELKTFGISAEPKKQSGPAKGVGKPRSASKAAKAATKMSETAKPKSKGKNFHISQPDTYPDSVWYAKQGTRLAFSILNSTPLYVDTLYKAPYFEHFNVTLTGIRVKSGSDSNSNETIVYGAPGALVTYDTIYTVLDSGTATACSQILSSKALRMPSSSDSIVEFEFGEKEGVAVTLDNVISA